MVRDDIGEEWSELAVMVMRLHWMRSLSQPSGAGGVGEEDTERTRTRRQQLLTDNTASGHESITGEESIRA